MRRTLRGKWGDGGFGSGGGGGGRSAGSYSDGGGSYYSDHDAVRGWDRAYLIAAAKREACGVDANAVAQYFPIDKVLKGVAALLSRVFNVHLREVEMERGESWHEGVRKLRVAAGGGGAGEGEDVGTIYLDLTPRPRKFPHAAHFVIRCGKALKNQKPSVALVCSFGGGGGRAWGRGPPRCYRTGKVRSIPDPTAFHTTDPARAVHAVPRGKTLTLSPSFVTLHPRFASLFFQRALDDR